MPLAGSLDIRSLLDTAPTVTLGAAEVCIDDVDILQVLYELRPSDIEGLVPPALNPTIPPVIAFLAYRAAHSPFGPFSLVQARLTARAGVRPRAFLVSACCDNPDAAAALSTSWGYRIRPAEIAMRRFHDRVDCTVIADRHPILQVGLIDPEPVSGHDIQYPPGMHLARVHDADGTAPRLVQVETEYEFRRADRGRPELAIFDAPAWSDQELIPVEPVSASFTACDVTITPVRYVCNPDLPASEGTHKVGDA
ncbi:MAG: acetoacetate decarboxylase family protein [Acidimicrobiales bacterium]